MPQATSEDRLDERVVITGVGLVCSLGRSRGELWEAMESARSGVRRIERFDATGLATQIAAEVAAADAPDDRFEADYWSALDARSRFAVSAALSAVQDAGLSITAQNRSELAVVIASEVAPDHAAQASPAASVAALLATTGPALQIGEGSAGGLAAITTAASMIRSGEALVAIAGGAEAPITPATVAAHGDRGLLSMRNADPPAASRPFDRDRDGYVLGEGAAMLVLESLTVARARGARVLAEVEGRALTFSPGSGGHAALAAAHIGEAFQRCLMASGRIQTEVDVIAMHAAGSVERDRAEAVGVRRIFGGAARHHLYSPATTSHTGHLLGASAPLAICIMLEAMQRQRVPGTRNLDHEDPDIDLDANANGARDDTVRIVIVSGIGDADSGALLLAHPEAMRSG